MEKYCGTHCEEWDTVENPQFRRFWNEKMNILEWVFISYPKLRCKDFQVTVKVNHASPVLEEFGMKQRKLRNYTYCSFFYFIQFYVQCWQVSWGITLHCYKLSDFSCHFAFPQLFKCLKCNLSSRWNMAEIQGFYSTMAKFDGLIESRICNLTLRTNS